MSEHERIWLEPICCEQIPEGRCWCQHRLDDCDEPDCGEKAVEFVRADIVAAKDAEIARLRAIIDAQIQWTPGEPPKEDGVVVYGFTWQPYRWKAYSPKSEQFRRGIKGRWQAMGEYGGWDNAPAPNEWATEEMVHARAALNGEAGDE